MFFRSPAEGLSYYRAGFAFDLVGNKVDKALGVLFAMIFIREDATAYVHVFSDKFSSEVGEMIIHRNLPVNFLWQPMLSRKLLLMNNASLLNTVLIDCEAQSVTIINFAPVAQRRGSTRAALIGSEYFIVAHAVDESYAVATVSRNSSGDKWSGSTQHSTRTGQGWRSWRAYLRMEVSQPSEKMIS